MTTLPRKRKSLHSHQSRPKEQMARLKSFSIACRIVLVILAVSFVPVDSLTEIEIASVEKLGALYPQLYRLPSGLHMLGKLEYGSRWDLDLSLACRQTPGWYFYGLFCENGAITAIHIDSYWGQAVYDSDFSILNFQFLKNITVRNFEPGYNSVVLKQLVKHVIGNNATALEHVQIEISLDADILIPSLYNHYQSIRVLTLPVLTNYIPPSYVFFTKLERLETIDMATPEYSGQTLKYLRTSVTNDRFNLSTLSTQYPALEELHLTYIDFSPTSLELAAGANLKILSLRSLTSSPSTPDFKFADPALFNTGLLHFNLTQCSLRLEMSWPKNIRSIFLHNTTLWLPIPAIMQPMPAISNLTLLGSTSIDDNFVKGFSYENLEELWLDTGVSAATIQRLKFLYTAPLSKFVLRTNDSLLDGALNSFICESLLNIDAITLNYGPNTTFAQKRLKHVSLYSFMETEIPPCVAELKNLEKFEWHSRSLPAISNSAENNSIAMLPSNITSLTLIIDDTTPKSANLDFLFSRFYNETSGSFGLKYLEFPNAGLLNAFPGETIASKAPFIEHIDFRGNQLSGTIPSGFFSRLEKLKYFDMSNNVLEGELPNAGLARIETLKFRGNRFSTWPSNPSDPFIALVEVDLSFNNLTDLPDDYTFARMPNLRFLDISGNSALRGPVPNVFGPNSKVEEFYARGCALDGPFPATVLANPVMRTLDLSKNFICAGLPDILTTPNFAPMLSRMILAENYFNGTYPSSWASLQAKKLDLSLNLIAGSLPNPFLFAYGYDSVQTQLLFHRVNFTGVIPGLKNFSSISTLDANYTDADLCTSLAQNSTSPNYITTCILPSSTCNCAAAIEMSCIIVTHLCQSPLPPSDYIEPPGAHAPSAMQCISSMTRASTSPEIQNLIPPSSSACQTPPPSADPLWICASNGTWVYTGSFTTTTFIIPAAPVRVNGNVTVSGTITFPAQGGVLIVTECIFIGDGKGKPSIIVELTPKDLEKIFKSGGSVTRTLIQSPSGNNCPGATDLRLVDAKLKIKGSSCKKAKIQVSKTSSRSTLNILMTVDNSTCNMIIIIPSVIGGVIILVVIAIVVWLAIKSTQAKTAKAVLNKN